MPDRLATQSESQGPVADAVVKAVLSVTGGPAPLHEPEFHGNEWMYVKECLDTGWVSSAGGYVGRFEEEIAEYTAAGHAVATVNGTAALHTALLLVGVLPGDAVIVPTFTFVATANAVSYVGAVPYFADVQRATLGIDPEKLGAHLDEVTTPGPDGPVDRRSGRRFGAVVAMHTFGHAVALDGLLDVCARHRVPLVEDAAESLGSTYRGRHAGTFGSVGILSFNGNKVLTTGGGGMVLTNECVLADAAKHLTTTAKLDHAWDYAHDRVGFNYRMPNINAALGCAQLEQLPAMLSKKRVLAERYAEAVAPLGEVEFVTEPPDAVSNYWLNAIIVRDRPVRDQILEATNRVGLMTRPAWRTMHHLPMYRNNPRMDLSVAEDLEERLINLPSGPGLLAGGLG